MFVCKCINLAKTTEPIAKGFCKTMSYITESYLGLFPFLYLSSFYDDASFRDVTICKTNNEEGSLFQKNALGPKII